MNTIKISSNQIINYLEKLQNYQNLLSPYTTKKYGGELYHHYMANKYYFKYKKNNTYINNKHKKIEEQYKNALVKIINEYEKKHLNKTNKNLANQLKQEILEPVNNYYDLFHLTNPVMIKITPSIEKTLKQICNAPTIEEIIKKHPYLYDIDGVYNPMKKTIKNAVLIRPRKIKEDDFLFLNKIDTIDLTKADIVHLSTSEILTQTNYQSNITDQELIVHINQDILSSIAHTQIEKLIPFNPSLKKEQLKYELKNNKEYSKSYLDELNKISYTYIHRHSLYNLLNKTIKENKITPITENLIPDKNIGALYVNKTYEDCVKLLEKQITDDDLEILQNLINQEE